MASSRAECVDESAHIRVIPWSADASEARNSPTRISPLGRLIKSVPCFPRSSPRRSRSLSSSAPDKEEKKRNAARVYDLFKRGQLHGDASSYTFSQPGLSSEVLPAHLTRSQTHESRTAVAVPKIQVGNHRALGSSGKQTGT